MTPPVPERPSSACFECGEDYSGVLQGRELPPGRLVCAGCLIPPETPILLPPGADLRQEQLVLTVLVTTKNGEPHGN